MLAGLWSGQSAMAVDGGTGVYLLGKRGPLAAFVPKPGWYVTNDVYNYDAGSSDYLPLGDRVVRQADVQALIDIVQLTYVTDLTVFGGRLAFSGVLPYGRVEVGGRGEIDLSDGSPVARGQSESATGFGDPALGAALGWKNRMEGDAVFLTLSMPLYIKTKPNEDQDWSQPEGGSQ